MAWRVTLQQHAKAYFALKYCFQTGFVLWGYMTQGEVLDSVICFKGIKARFAFTGSPLMLDWSFHSEIVSLHLKKFQIVGYSAYVTENNQKGNEPSSTVNSVIRNRTSCDFLNPIIPVKIAPNLSLVIDIWPLSRISSIKPFRRIYSIPEAHAPVKARPGSDCREHSPIIKHDSHNLRCTNRMTLDQQQW